MAQNRSIFEDVTTETAEKMKIAPRDNNPKSVRKWLCLLFALVAIMILVGGLTRLTDSGLSITDWDLVMGTLPPLSDAAWAENFTKYQNTQEYQLQNANMTLAEYKGIFWWEWGHRFLGRVIGLVWIVGFLIFLARKQIRRDRMRGIFSIGILIGLQGVIGILMVKTGYVGDRVDVASYALAAHLGLAFIILGAIFWNIKYLSQSPEALIEARRRGDASRASMARVLAAFVFLQILLGALVAGIDGGLSYNDWPKMGGEWFSSDAFVLQPAWKNLFENPALVQFMHRINGYILIIFAFMIYWKNRRAPYKQWRSIGLHVLIAIFVQVVIGIGTLVMHVPLPMALLHQAAAIAIWVAVLSTIFAFKFPKAQSVRDV